MTIIRIDATKQYYATSSLVVGYALCSSLLTVINKIAITNFNHPGLLTALQYLTSASLVWIIGKLGFLYHDPLNLETAKKFLPAAIIFYLAIFTNTNLLRHANIDTFIVFRSLTPLLVAIADTAFRNQPCPSKLTFLSLVIILSGAVGYVMTDSAFTLTAYSWALANLITITSEMVYIKHIVTNLGLNTWGFVLYNNILSLLMTPLFLVMTGEYAEVFAAFGSNNGDLFDSGAFVAVSLSCVFGFLISFFGFAARKAISATAFTVAGGVLYQQSVDSKMVSLGHSECASAKQANFVAGRSDSDEENQTMGISNSGRSPVCLHPPKIPFLFPLLGVKASQSKILGEREAMEGVIQSRGLLSLPSNPQARAFHPLRSLGARLYRRSSRPASALPPSISVKARIPVEINRGFGSRAQNSWNLSESLRFCDGVRRARDGVRKRDVAPGAAVPADGAGFTSPALEKAKLKFLGVDNTTLKKIIPLGLMFFCILFNYTILRDTKDVLVVTAKGSSAEIIPFLKTWVNLPMAIGFMLLYTKLSNALSKEALFYTVLLPFIAFFGAFGFILYPLNNVIHPTALADKLLAALGPSFLGPVAILRIWSFCLFYVMAELWGSVVISVLFWGFANQITTVEEAKEFYPLFGLGANIALIFSGRTVKYFSNLRKTLGPGVDGWAVSLKGMMSIVVILGFVICGIYWGVNRFIVNDPSIPRTERKKKEKPKLGMGESLKVLISSRYVRDLATLVVAYGISINLVEVTWKSKLKAQFPSPNEYSSFMGDFSTATGIATFTMMLLGRVILRKFGWGVAAMITPTVLLLTGVGFFSLILFGEPLVPLLAQVGMTPLLAAVYVGALQNIFSKSAKYSLFDPCKEMAYIPLDEEMKVKGKAAIDVVCNPLGKSGGALIQQFMILTFGSLANSTPYLGGILLVIVLAWLGAAKSLDSQFSPLAKQELEKERVKEKTKEPVIEVSAIQVSSLVEKEDNGSLPEPKSSNGSALKQKIASEPETPSQLPQ